MSTIACFIIPPPAYPLNADLLPVGGMFRVPLFEPAYVGPDGQSWAVKTPGGVWFIDYPSHRGARWMRTGEAPVMTAMEMCLMGDPPRWKGWLRDGHLVPA